MGVAKQVERVLEMSPAQHADSELDSTTLEKSSHLANPHAGFKSIGFHKRPRVPSVSIAPFHKCGPRVWPALAACCHSFHVMATSSKAEELLTEGKMQYASGNRGNAFNSFEEALKEENIDKEVQQELLYCCLACSAVTGDMEQAKMYLREMTLSGLTFERALEDSSLMPFESTAFVKKQLKGFSQGTLPKQSGQIQRERLKMERVQQDEGGPLPEGYNFDDLDSGDLDVSVFGVFRRVVLVIVALVLLYTGLFFYGLQFIEPN